MILKQMSSKWVAIAWYFVVEIACLGGGISENRPEIERYFLHEGGKYPIVKNSPTLHGDFLEMPDKGTYLGYLLQNTVLFCTQK